MTNTDLIALLERLLDDARSGEMTGLQFTAFRADGRSNCGFVNCQEEDLSTSQKNVRQAAEGQVAVAHEALGSSGVKVRYEDVLPNSS